MLAFLEQVVRHIHETFGENTQKLAVVLPNKRAALFLKKYFRQIYQKTIILPRIYSAEEFFSEISGLHLADSVTLQFELYKAYQYVLKDQAEPFPEFLRWASIALHDFSECDRYMLNAQDLFQNLKNIKAIENWSLSEEKLSPMQEKFLSFMNNLGEVYFCFREKLKQAGIAYEGMSVRTAAEKSENHPFFSKHSHFIICGFNALNKAETSIFNYLKKTGKGTLLWDSDNYYLKNQEQEAGLFLRKNLEWAGPLSEKWQNDFLLTENKTINITGIPGKTGQSAVAAKHLKAIVEKNPDLENTAIVLADESLLTSVMSLLPENIKSINITLEYPIRHTAIFGLIEDLIGLHYNLWKNKKGGFYFRDFLTLISNPYFSEISQNKKSLHQLERNLKKKNIVYVSEKFLQEVSGENFSFFLKSWSKAEDAQNCLTKLLESLEKNLETKTDGIAELDKAIINELQKNLNFIQSLLNKYGELIDLTAYRELFRQIISQVTVPFIGEPLSGLQIMGVLETRTLDFENIIMLGVNEETLPKGKSQNSFIPYDLKKFFGLPGHIEKDAIYAYHFYRLIQRAKALYFIYNTQHDKLGRGEKSRFLEQLINELAPKNSAIALTEKIQQLELPKAPEETEINIPKTQRIIDSLLAKFNAENQTGLSPSTLNSYKKCSLQFYYRYYLGMKKSDDIEENMEDGTFGSILHKALENLYTPFLGKTLNSSELKKRSKATDEICLEAYSEIYQETEKPNGKNLIAFEVIKEFVQRQIQEDIQRCETLAKKNEPLQIMALEKKLSANLKIVINGIERSIKFGGSADRIDSHPDFIQLIDYKTSARQSDNFNINHAKFDFYHTNNDKQFQLLMYCWLWFESNPSYQGKIFPSFFVFRNPKGKEREISLIENNNPFFATRENIKEFEAFLKQLIAELLNPELPFTQTEDVSRCEYCDFKDLCRR